MRSVLALSLLILGCAARPTATGQDQHRVRIQLTQGAQPPAVVGDHVCHADPIRDPRAVWLTCVGPGGPALLRALRGAPGVLAADPAL